RLKIEEKRLTELFAPSLNFAPLRENFSQRRKDMKEDLRRKAVFVFLLLLALITCLSGCSSRRETPATTNATREVTDEAGRRVRVPAHPQRIITLAPNLTEIVYAVGAGNRLIGDTTFCDFPPEAKQIEKVGDTLQPNIERIIALKPDIVLVSTASQLEAFTKQMNERDIPVFITDPHDLEGVFQSIRTIGDLLGQQEQAEKLIADLRARVASVQDKVKDLQPVTVFYQVSASPLWTAGKKSWITDLIRRAGGRSVTGDIEGEWMRYSDEAALASHPDAIIIAASDSMNGSKMEVAPALQKSPAVLNKRVYGINGDYLSRPGPRLVDGLEQIAHVLHPEAFKQ
ncbi:MAG TPA: cobalamin-binding protein, partial [Pyrinomonadaceae bacterium]|nr:cobalamin-binding protein [Pyrinomonadaceae bacterium]